MTRNIEEIVNQDLAIASVGAAVTDGTDDHVAVLLALYNGAATLGAQIESLATQSHENWSLIVSDDGSTDSSIAELARAAKSMPGRATQLIRGPRKGFAQNFLTLVRAAGPMVPYAAFCDQDDAWLPHKLSRALDHLSSIPSHHPALYAARTVICDARLRPLRRSPLFERPPSFANALVQSIGGGNTMLLNRAALDILQDASRSATGIVAHDWWAYQMVTGAGGTAIYDPEPTVLYRQHGANMIGANDTALAGFHRITQVMRGRYRHWNDANIGALLAARHFLTPEAHEILARFQEARTAPMRRRTRALRQAGLYRQTRRGNLALWMATVARKL